MWFFFFFFFFFLQSVCVPRDLASSMTLPEAFYPEFCDWVLLNFPLLLLEVFNAVSHNLFYFGEHLYLTLGRYFTIVSHIMRLTSLAQDLVLSFRNLQIISTQKDWKGPNLQGVLFPRGYNGRSLTLISS